MNPDKYLFHGNRRTSGIPLLLLRATQFFFASILGFIASGISGLLLATMFLANNPGSSDGTLMTIIVWTTVGLGPIFVLALYQAIKET